MNIEIRDPNLQARLQRQMEVSRSTDPEEVLVRLLDTQEELDRWLELKREFIDDEIQRGLDELDRGEIVPESELDAYLAKMKSSSE